MQAQWHLPDGPDVLRDVFAGLSIAARGRAHQDDVFVAQAECQPVEFQLGRVVHLWVALAQAEFTPHTRIEGDGARLGRVGLGADAEHGHSVAHGIETFEDVAEHALRGRVSCANRGMRLLQVLQLAEQAVVLRIGDLGPVEHVVEMGMAMQAPAQFLCAALHVRLVGLVGRPHARAFHRQLNSRRATAEPAPRPRASSVSYSRSKSLAMPSKACSVSSIP